ncbi:MAG: type II toxin-antitoxin system HicA family toxin [Synechococcaceae cyanobacterium]
MSVWSASKAKRVLAALESIGWRVKRQSGSHRILCREEIGPRMLARLARHTGLTPGDL